MPHPRGECPYPIDPDCSVFRKSFLAQGNRDSLPADCRQTFLDAQDRELRPFRQRRQNCFRSAHFTDRRRDLRSCKAPPAGEECDCLPRPVLRRSLAELLHSAGGGRHRAQRRTPAHSRRPGVAVELSGARRMGEAGVCRNLLESSCAPAGRILLSAEPDADFRRICARSYGASRRPRGGGQISCFRL